MNKSVLSVLKSIGLTLAFIFGCLLATFGVLLIISLGSAKSSVGPEVGLPIGAFVLLFTFVIGCIIVEETFPLLRKVQKIIGVTVVVLVIASAFVLIYIDEQRHVAIMEIKRIQSEQEAKQRQAEWNEMRKTEKGRHLQRIAPYPYRHQ
jgi:cell division protein FtsL